MADTTTTTQLPQNLQDLLDQYWKTALNVGNSMMDPNGRPMPVYSPDYHVPGPNWLQSATVPVAYDILQRQTPGMKTVDAGNTSFQETMGGKYYERNTGRNPYEGAFVTPDKNPYAGSNPYLDQMIAKAQGDVTNQYRTGTAATLNGTAAMANAFGGSGHQEATAQNERNLADSLSNISNQMRFQDYTTQQGLAESSINRAAANDQMNLQRNSQLAADQMKMNEQSFQNERARSMAAAGQAPSMAAVDVASLSPASGVGQSMYNITQQQNQQQIRNDLQQLYPEMAAMDIWKNGAGMGGGNTVTQSGGGNTNLWGQVAGGIGTGWALGDMFGWWR